MSDDFSGIQHAAVMDEPPPDEATQPEQLATGFAVLFLVRKKAGMDFSAFRSHQLDTHLPLALALPELLDYRLTLFEPSDDGEPYVDAIVQLTFVDESAYEAAMGSAAGTNALEDLPNMLDMASVRLLKCVDGNSVHAVLSERGRE